MNMDYKKKTVLRSFFILIFLLFGRYMVYVLYFMHYNIILTSMVIIWYERITVIFYFLQEMKKLRFINMILLGFTTYHVLTE